MVICLEQGADLRMAQLMPLPLTVSCFSKIQIGLPSWYRLTWVVVEKGPLNGCVCVCVCVLYTDNMALITFACCMLLLQQSIDIISLPSPQLQTCSYVENASLHSCLNPPAAFYLELS